MRVGASGTGSVRAQRERRNSAWRTAKLSYDNRLITPQYLRPRRRLQSRVSAAMCLAGALALSAQKASSEELRWKWVMTDFMELSLPIVFKCAATWACQPSSSVMHGPDLKIDSERTVGNCGAGSGPVNQCNVCFAPQPDRPCSGLVPAD